MGKALKRNWANKIDTKPFQFKDTSATQKIFDLDKRIRAVAGGTSASKTISILVWLIDYCQCVENKNKLCTVVSESYPHLEKGAMLDFQNIMKDRGYWKEALWHGTKHQYTFETGNKLEFTSVDYSKAHGPRRDVLFVNECNNLDYKTVDQLMTRTREIIWLDWNPSEEFWFYTELLPSRPDDIDFITLTYLDNEALDKVMIQDIESHKGNIAWWTVYGLGQLGATEQRIYKDWQIIDDVPFEAKLMRYGLDFGYTNDPTAIVALYYYNGGYIVDEIAYQKGLMNKPIADILNNQVHKAIVIADSSEPKSIDEIRPYGITILPCQKGPGSINRGIGYVQQQRISVTNHSTNILKEYRRYLWIMDKDGRIINEAMDENNHAMDAIRYAIASIKDPNQQGAHVHYAQSNMPRNNLTPFQDSMQTVQGLPPELQDNKPVYAHTHVPRL